ncbi:hypothetical protein GCM10022243_49240 [Saccharothrix violaceirubra]|uniref:Uncharacterized protein n=1 Tax=Saccharothrix violaceirubra TaxID=413306 RepID=A0A7W7T0G0_9PSEU|nr:hypothetical protein [Saccharothrix violaceirubra]MBB4963732.1 hypothetical protein [Saccharothrix violaceirubra]
MTRRRWGKAGVQLTPREASHRDRLSVLRNAERKRQDEAARQKWLQGLVVPAHITMALDAAGLHGPEVDWACGVNEPDVDNWESGLLYPRWEQLLRLAEITSRRPMYFMAPVHQITSIYDTSMRFHLVPGDRHPLPVHRYRYRALVDARQWGVRA